MWFEYCHPGHLSRVLHLQFTVWANRTGHIISFIFAPSHFGQPHSFLSLSFPPSTCCFNHEPLHSWCPPRAEFWRSAGSANSFLYFYFGCRGELLSLEDGTSSGGGQEAERTKREGPSEYEITLENKTKQVCFIYTFKYVWDKAVSICFRIRSCCGWSLDVAPLLTERTPIELYFCPCWHEKEHQRICHRSDRNTKDARLS